MKGKAGLLLALLLFSLARAQEAIPFDPPSFDKFTGFYQVYRTTVLTVKRQANQYFVQLTRQPPFEIFPETSTRFFMRELPVKITFETDTAGNAMAAVAHQGGRDSTASRIDDSTAAAIAAAPTGHPMPRTWELAAITPRILTDSDDGRLGYWPCFSPDGQTVLFSESHDGGRTWQLMRVPTAGGAGAIDQHSGTGLGYQSELVDKRRHRFYGNHDG